MRLDWDEAKRFANIEKHGIDFADVPSLFDGEVIRIISARKASKYEERSYFEEIEY